MINIQDEVQKIHHQYGMSDVANYKIQLLFERYAKEYHDSEVKKLNIPAVSGAKRKVCPVCKKTFEKGWGEFCSQDCWDTDMQGKLTANVPRVCVVVYNLNKY